MNLSKEDCEEWKRNPLINPVTRRAIQKNKGVYNNLKKNCYDKYRISDEDDVTYGVVEDKVEEEKYESPNIKIIQKNKSPEELIKEKILNSDIREKSEFMDNNILEFKKMLLMLGVESLLFSKNANVKKSNFKVKIKDNDFIHQLNIHNRYEELVKNSLNNKYDEWYEYVVYILKTFINTIFLKHIFYRLLYQDIDFETFLTKKYYLGRKYNIIEYSDFIKDTNVSENDYFDKKSFSDIWKDYEVYSKVHAYYNMHYGFHKNYELCFKMLKEKNIENVDFIIQTIKEITVSDINELLIFKIILYYMYECNSDFNEKKLNIIRNVIKEKLMIPYGEEIDFMNEFTIRELNLCILIIQSQLENNNEYFIYIMSYFSLKYVNNFLFKNGRATFLSDNCFEQKCNVSYKPLKEFIKKDSLIVINTVKNNPTYFRKILEIIFYPLYIKKYKISRVHIIEVVCLIIKSFKQNPSIINYAEEQLFEFLRLMSQDDINMSNKIEGKPYLNNTLIEIINECELEISLERYLSLYNALKRTKVFILEENSNILKEYSMNKVLINKVTKQSIINFLDRSEPTKEELDEWKEVWNIQHPDDDNPPPPPDWWLKGRSADVHTKRHVRITDCRIKLLLENIKEKLDIDVIAYEIEQETKRLSVILADEDKLSGEERKEFIKNYTLTKEDILRCRVDINEPRLYGYGGVFRNQDVLRMSEDQRVELCDLVSRIWTVIKKVENEEMYRTLIMQFVGAFKEHLLKGVCNQGWVGSLTSIFGGYAKELGYLCMSEEDINSEVDVLVKKYLIDMRDDIEVDYPTVSKLFIEISRVIEEAKYLEKPEDEDDYDEDVEYWDESKHTPEENEKFKEKVKMYDIMFDYMKTVDRNVKKETIIKFISDMIPSFFMQIIFYNQEKDIKEDIVKIKKAVKMSMAEFLEYQLDKLMKY